MNNDHLAHLLEKVPTSQLAAVFAMRPNIESALINPATGRTLTSDGFNIRRQLGAIVCTDMVPVFEDDKGVVWGGCIVRGGNQKSPHYGLWAFDGGVIGFHKTIDQAMRYHAGVDLGLEIELPLGAEYPVRVNQYDPPMEGGIVREGFLPEFDKHSVGLLHLVYISGDPSNPKFSKKSDQQEALGFTWFNLENAPPLEKWAYLQGAGWREVVIKATELRDRGILKLPKLPKTL